MKIIVGFSQGNTVFAKLISYFTRSNISHTYIRIPFEGNPALSVVFHASKFNVHYLNYDMFLKTQKKIVAEWEIELTEEQWLHAQSIRFLEAGKPYGWMQILGYIWVIYKKSKLNPLNDGNKSHVCVELTAKLMGIKDAETLLPYELEHAILEQYPDAVLLTP